MKYALLALLIASTASANPPRPIKVDQHQAQHQQQTQRASAKSDSYSKSDATSASESNASTGDSTSSINENDIKQAPTVVAPPVYASAVCSIGASGGLSIPGGGVTFGKSTLDTQCDIREAVRVLSGIGQAALALKVACTLDAVKAAGITPADCTLPPPAPEPPATCLPARDCAAEFKQSMQK